MIITQFIPHHIKKYSQSEYRKAVLYFYIPWNYIQPFYRVLRLCRIDHVTLAKNGCVRHAEIQLANNTSLTCFLPFGIAAMDV